MDAVARALGLRPREGDAQGGSGGGGSSGEGRGGDVGVAEASAAPAAGEGRDEEGVLAVADDEALRSVLKVSGSRPVVVDFGADWCTHCAALLPELGRTADEHPELCYVLADVDALPAFAGHMRYTPTVSVFRSGRKVDEVAGCTPQALRDHVWLHTDQPARPPATSPPS